CVQSTDRNLGEALGQVYVEKYFPPAAKARAREMVQNLITALRDDIPTLTWMGSETKKEALAKLEAFHVKIGYTDQWRDYSRLSIDRRSYASNVRRSFEFEYARQLAKIAKPVDRTEWGMTPPTVNAYYNASMNEIVFPAGILQPPFYDPNADDAVNYGGIGAVIGHEISHGFDDPGSNLGGLAIAYAAYEKSIQGKRPKDIDGFTPEQRFFLGWAQVWGTNQRPEAA